MYMYALCVIAECVAASYLQTYTYLMFHDVSVHICTCSVCCSILLRHICVFAVRAVAVCNVAVCVAVCDVAVCAAASYSYTYMYLQCVLLQCVLQCVLQRQIRTRICM